jgi:hypothetical protein
MNTHALLEAWDAGQRQGPEQWALTLLAAADPSQSREEHARSSIGRRNALLLNLRDATFGTRLRAGDDCPHCGQAVEIEIDSSRLHCPSAPRTEAPASVDLDGFRISLRLPDTYDLLAIAACTDVEDAAAVLLDRCVKATSADSFRVVEAADLPADVAHAVSELLADADPQATPRLSMRCPACRGDWHLAFDVVSYFWQELDAWVSRLLHEVHDLAVTYGWSESDILAMSSTRRRFYLGMQR